MTMSELEQAARDEPGAFVMCADVPHLERVLPEWRQRFMCDRSRRWAETTCVDCGIALVVSDRVPREPVKVCVPCTVVRIHRGGWPSSLRVLGVSHGLLKEALLAV